MPQTKGVDAMPYARPSRCSTPGCGTLATNQGRCDEHQRKAWENTSANTRTLTSSERARFRAMVLRKNPQCSCTGWCGHHQGPCSNAATEADHIIPIALGGAHHAGNNGQGLCGPCHLVKSRADARSVRQARSAGGRP